MVERDSTHARPGMAPTSDLLLARGHRGGALVERAQPSRAPRVPASLAGPTAATPKRKASGPPEVAGGSDGRAESHKMPTLGSKQRAKRKQRQIAEGKLVLGGGAPVAVAQECSICGTGFPSKTKLFKHLHTGAFGGEACMARVVADLAADGVAPPKPTARFALCVGYIADRYTGLGAEFQGHFWQADGLHGEVERLVWAAAAAANGAEPEDLRTGGRASGTNGQQEEGGNKLSRMSRVRSLDPSGAPASVATSMSAC